MQYLFMNERIRQAKPSKPVIVCQGDGTQRESNEFQLWHHGEMIGRVVFDRRGLKECDTHEVRAWVELSDLVTVSSAEDRKPKAPVASAKLPGRKVQLAP